MGMRTGWWKVEGVGLLNWIAGAVVVVRLAVPGVPDLAAETWGDTPYEVRSVYPAELGLPDPVGLAFDSAEGVLLVVGGPGGSTVGRLTTVGDALAPVVLEGVVADGITLAFDAVGDRLVFVDRSSQELVGVTAAALRGEGSPASDRGDARGLSLGDPTGTAFDPRTGTWFVLDRSNGGIVRIDPVEGDGSVVGDLIGGEVRVLALGEVPAGDLRGLALNPSNGHLYVMDAAGRELFELDQEARRVDTHDLASIGLSNPQGMAFAPSGDPTDEPGEHSLYVVDAGGGAAQGRIVELSFEPLIAPTITDVATLVQTIDASVFSPPSPDPAGIVYLPGADRLLVSDSEVDEMAIFAGVNLFKIRRNGTLIDTGVTTAFSNEPTGLGFNPSNEHLFVSDDITDEIYEVDAGGDGRYGTGDDLVLSFDTATFTTDPEDVAYDSLRNELLIVDGLGREVYRVSPGPNGLFDGGDDVVTHFDLEVLGAVDPEGIARDAGRDTLLIADRGPNVVFEVTPTGSAVRTIDISAAGADVRASGVELAPTSTDPGQSSLYVTDRGIDNDIDPNENDGKIYELRAPAGSANLPPSVAAGPDQTVILPDLVLLDGTVSDDGRPDPPGSVTTLWRKVSGPGAVSFADAAAVDTTASFSVAGTYVLELQADDSDLSSADPMVVEAFDPGGPFTFRARIASGSDDAEEQVLNSQMDLTSIDLDMTTQGSVVFRVGLRFRDVDLDPDASITNATIQFRADEPKSVVTNLTIHGQDIGDAPSFTPTVGDLSGRTLTAASVSWSPPAWDLVGEAGPDQRTTNLGPVIEEIISRPDWSAGNALVFIITGVGERTADSYEGDFASLLEVEYTLPQAPEMDVQGNSMSIADGDTTPTSADHTDFGAVLVEAGSVTRTFTIRNIGNAGLSLTDSPRVTIGGPHAADFALTSDAGSPVAAGAQTAFQVRFASSAVGLRQATIRIANSDADENPYNFSIQGTGADSTFPDVPSDHWAWAYVEAIFNAGLTAGYPDGTYRPDSPVTRAEMAVFLKKGIHGSSYTPPTPDGSHPFSDISGHWAEAWIEDMYGEGLTSGFPDFTYRPENQVTRAEMAVFLLKAMNGSGYMPPAPDGSHPFSDIAGHWAEAWMEDLYDAGITSGYPDGTYRPDNQVTRAEMAVFLVRAFALVLP